MRQIALGPLSRQALRNCLNSRFAPNRFDPELPVLIHRRTEGLRRKIGVLEAEDRRALEYASIQGEEFTSVLLAGLLGADDVALEERLDRLDKVHRLIQTIGEEELPDETFTTRYRFAHVLYQNAVYADLMKKRRVLLHGQTGDLMMRIYRDDAPRLAGQLAMHFERGRDFERTVEFLVHAGDNAMQIHANEKAIEHYSRALGFMTKLACEKQARLLSTIYRKRGAAYLATGRFNDAIEDFTNLLHQARTVNDRAMEHGALNALAEAYFFAHRLDDVDKCAGEALRIAEELRDQRLRVETVASIAMRQTMVGELVEAKRNLDEIIRIARRFEYRRALLYGLAWRGQLYFFQSQYECAREVLLEAFNLASDLRHGPLLIQTQFFLGLSLGNMGRISEALTVLRRDLETARRNGDGYWLAKIFNCIGWIYRELENFEEAAKYDTESLEVARANKVGEAETNALINLGYDCTHRADPEKARSSFEKARAILEIDVWLQWGFQMRLFTGQATHHLLQRHLDEAERYAMLLSESANRYEARKYIAIADKLLAEIAITRGDLATAETHLNAAVHRLAAYPVPFVEWRIYSLLGRLRLQLGGGTADEAFEKASRIVQSIAANIEDEKLRVSFLRSRAVQELKHC